jgi:hypothetical protein
LAQQRYARTMKGFAITARRSFDVASQGAKKPCAYNHSPARRLIVAMTRRSDTSLVVLASPFGQFAEEAADEIFEHYPFGKTLGWSQKQITRLMHNGRLSRLAAMA